MPFKNKKQMRACFAKKDPNWDCKKWARETDMTKIKEFAEFLEEIYPEIFDEAKKEKWIQGAVKNKGAFTDYCGGKVTDKCIEKGEKSSDPTTKKRANLADTFRKMKKSKD